MIRKSSERSEVRAGVFVFLALAILGLGTLWIVGFKPLAGRQMSYDVWMKGSSGVRRGDRVRVSGIEAGRVKKIELRAGQEWPVVFQVALDRDVTISTGSTARIATDGLLGAPYLEIVAGPAEASRLPEGSRIMGVEGGTMTQTLEGLGQATDKLPELLAQTTELVDKLNGTVDPVMVGLQELLSAENLEAVAETLKVLGPTLEEVGPGLAELVSHLDSLAGKIEEGVGGVPEVTSEISSLAGDLRHAVGTDGERLSDLLDSVSLTMGSARGALAAVEGNRIEMDAMLRDLRAAAANLKSLSQTLKERPSLLLRYPRAPERKAGEKPD